VFQRDSPTVDDSSLLIHEALLLAFRYVDFIPVVRPAKLAGSIGGLEVLNVLRVARRSGFRHLLQAKIAHISRPAGMVAPRDSLQSLLTVMLGRRLGHACIVQDGELTATIGLRDVVRWASSAYTETGVEVSKLANPTISLPSTATLSEMLDLMMERRVRRMLVRGEGLGKVADDRVVVEYAFGHEGILTLRDRPDDFWNHPMGDLPLRDVWSIDGRADVAEAWRMMYNSPAECLLVDGKILTPWDVVIRICQSTNLPVRSNLELLVATCFEATLRGLLGDTGSSAVLSKFQSEFALTPFDICDKPREVSEILVRIFGGSGPVVERAFVRRLCAEFGIPPGSYNELSETLNHVKARFEASGGRGERKTEQ
jgi:CBS domain-containing protein